MSDNVNHPQHYCDGGIEAIDYLRAKLTPEEFRGFLKGNALKYLSRAGKKDDELEDLRKAQWYTSRLVEEKSKCHVDTPEEELEIDHQLKMLKNCYQNETSSMEEYLEMAITVLEDPDTPEHDLSDLDEYLDRALFQAEKAAAILKKCLTEITEIKEAQDAASN